MRIIEMTATFGKLDGETLRLKPGMNWIVAPNEWGKSTWCAFLTAMLYGIDTRERSGKDSLAEKERYAPWSGKPMEGQIRVFHQGRDITIQRRTKGRVPLGDFSAFETDSGLPIHDLTAENCGQVLVGVERSVFRRSGFIRLQEMPVTQDEALRRRLNALVTTADESDAADKLAQKLKDLKNRCRYNRSGLIPQTRQRLEELDTQLQQRQALDSRLTALMEKEKETADQITRLECHLQWMEYRRYKSSRKQLAQAEEAEADARQRLRDLRERCQHHPSRLELEELLRQPEPLQPKNSGAVWLALSLLSLLGAGILAWWEMWFFAAVAALAAIGLGWCCYLKVRQYNRACRQIQARIDRRTQWSLALSDWEELERCRRQTEQARDHADTLRAMVQKVDRPGQEDTLDISQEETNSRMEAARKKLGQYHQLRGECLGRMESLPQVEAITRQIGQTQSRLKELELTYTALGYAQKALEEATETLQKRFAPKITRRAQQILSRLTQGRYDRLQMSHDFALMSAASDEVTQRGSLWRSDGTVDQMYLALRVAVWEELTPTAPLVIDDALVRFDDRRLAAAREVLEELAKEHQIIVFVCR